ncbi:hypothetical protein LEP1GSC188_1389 [Leptospira weilii serovar Topaz str. LT2116]|uniref:Uncharacterized protein n=1 Tax=Leptospira weilii serovar Topaz str. LT2116 TaxID=1088540 RepID=M3H406_9LEPT|nr:hypothetical protein LEP1GSC188_1389 [Leptospira weilii serovar Topaz str. LT2116]
MKVWANKKLKCNDSPELSTTLSIITNPTILDPKINLSNSLYFIEK